MIVERVPFATKSVAQTSERKVGWLTRVCQKEIGGSVNGELTSQCRAQSQCVRETEGSGQELCPFRSEG